MASMYPISVPSASRVRKAAGFTLAELMVASGLSAIVFAGILSAYTFLGKNLTRLANAQEVESKSRSVLQSFARDVAAASIITTASDGNMTLSVVSLVGSTPTTTTVSYSYDSAAGTLTRTEASSSKVLLSGISQCAFNYYNKTNVATTTPLSVKEIEVAVTASQGMSATSTLVSFTTISPRLLLRNKSFPQ